MKFNIALFCGLALFGLASQAVAQGAAPTGQGATLEAIKQRGALQCSTIAGGSPGFFELDDKGRWHGFDSDICRSVATAILGSPDKANFVPLSWPQRFPALQSGSVDIVVNHTSWTLQRNSVLGFQFTLPYFFGGTQFMIKKSANVATATQLNGATVCVPAGTTTERLAADYLASKNLTFTMLPFEKTEDARAAYIGGRCDTIAGWGPTLAVFGARRANDASPHMVLPEVLTNEPVSAVVRQGDEKFLILVNWVIAALIEAEELGITSANIEKMKEDKDPRIARLMGKLPGLGKGIGLRDTWAYDVVKHVGNYSEIFERNLGSQSPYKLTRGLTKLWKDGGVLYAPVFD
ncbi:amino acid ABC transporter substrate-binding protein [Ferrovibrio sp.]|uniref:amino acid ABC transporter substrate-binding protein n=1 Tax=Ferrovibrio sp. TaxID=1917215 RepID=UPI001B72368D|nr:amino acid ABC transporter substrate-binding protein [Ferrovibrio sp.]MBP7063205.1 amino acid ABC transporter substrate-binding protein [Ferrovibrio sp.]